MSDIGELRALLQKFTVAQEALTLDELTRMQYLLLNAKDGSESMNFGRILFAGAVDSLIRSRSG